MKIILTLVGLFVTVFFAGTSKTRNFCSNTNRLLHIGEINLELSLNITAMHNHYRLKIAQGEVSGQPRGSNMHRLYYDKQLAAVAKEAAMECSLDAGELSDPRWYTVGHNAYLEYSNEQSFVQNWDRAINAWFEERINYIYPERAVRRQYPRATSHYTQLVWADSQNVGCEFIVFKNSSMPKTPYGKFYLCTYGPGGNINGQLPYIVGNSTICEHLC